MIVFEPVQAAIWHCLNHYTYSDAIFLAERLYAEVDTDDSLFLLATCYYRAGQLSMAYSVLRKKETHCPQSRYLLARCCVDMQKFAEAESVLTGEIVLKSKDVNVEELTTEFGDKACFVLKLLALIASKTHRHERAAELFKKSLKVNPFLWNSFEQLCNMGHKLDPNEIFSVSKLDNFSYCHGVNPVVNYVNNNLPDQQCAPASQQADPYFKNVLCTPVQVMNVASSGTCCVRLFSTPEDSVPVTPGPLVQQNLKEWKNSRLRNGLTPLQIPKFGLLPFPADTPSPDQQLSVSPEIYDSKPYKHLSTNNKETPLQQGKSVFTSSVNMCNAVNINQPVVTPPPQNVRRSTRLYSSCSVKENTKSPKHSKFVSPKSPIKKTKRGVTKSNLNYNDISLNNEKNRNNERTNIPMETITVDVKNNAATATMQAVQIQKDAAEGLMNLFKDIGIAYLNLSKFECLEAVECFNKLSPAQKNTGWVMAMIAKAYFELPDYPNSVKYFQRMRKLDPERLEFTDLFSTALWFLQREVELSALSQELVIQSRLAPETWCSTANCFSLHKEHETAIKFLHRAVQVDQNFSYAYTLLGHEYLATEELDKAMSCFRNAIRINNRDYSAYFGLGSVYSKQEKYELAQSHYFMANKINPKNVVILCHIGVVQNAQQKTDAALYWLGKALDIDPKNPLSKFHRANIYFNLSRHKEALEELEELKQIVPKESLVYYLTGKIHKKLGDTHLALMHFSWAMDLDPKGTHTQIKETIDPSSTRASGEDETLAPDDVSNEERTGGETSTYESPSDQLQPVNDRDVSF